jgi:hypothetical protein
MQTVHPTLLIGPSDWDAERMPRLEFARRLDALWAAHPDVERAIVFGNSRHHAELAYFTNLVPKLGPALALLSRGSEHRMFVGDAANMLGAARPLTFIENLASMKDAAAGVAAGEPRSLLIGADYMPTALRATLAEAAGKDVTDATAAVWRLMSRKSSHELDAIDAAVKLMGTARTAMREALMAGGSATDAVLAGERAANGGGAQDVRTLLSLDGGRTLRPFSSPVRESTGPLLTYLAIRRFNYWAESFPLFTTSPEPTTLYDKAWDILRRAAGIIKAGVAMGKVASLIANGIAPCQAHPVTAKAWVQRMGLALDESPHTAAGGTFEDGEVYSLRIGATDEQLGHLICSRMFVVGQEGITALDEEIS